MEQAARAESAETRSPGTANISSRCGADPDGVVKAVDMLLAPIVRRSSSARACAMAAPPRNC